MNIWALNQTTPKCSHARRWQACYGASPIRSSRKSNCTARRLFSIRQRCCRLRVKAENADQSEDSTSLAPVKTRTAVGKMLNYYLKMEPHLFDTAMEKQLEELQAEKERKEQDAQQQSPTTTDSSEMVLYRRINEARGSEQRMTLEDIMYICVLEKFVKLGVPMMPRLENVTDSQTGNFKKLTEGIHSQEALEMVKTHVRSLMGPAVMHLDSSLIRLPKLQAVQTYATSIMFGYFVRRLDSRFQLERSAGLIGAPDEKEEAISRLERLFSQADSMDVSSSPDSATPSEASSSNRADSGSSSSTSSTSEPGFQSDTASSNMSGSEAQGKPRKGSLREYVEKFSPETVKEMASVVSMEAAQLIGLQMSALFGDYHQLQEQMQKAVGSEFISVDELMQRVAKEMEAGSIESIVISVGTQRRFILEAIAFGTFLRDVESDIDSNYGLLTAVANTRGGPELPPPGLTGAF